jgi:hypothetical protein
MGKRELLIIVAFIAVGAAAYQLTASPPKEGEGFSISRLWRNTRRAVRGNAVMSTHVTSDRLAIAASVKQIRIGGVNRGIKVEGEDRTDIAYEFSVTSTGPDEATASRLARQAQITRDVLDESVGLRGKYPQQGSQYASIVVKVPSRLTVRLDGPLGSQQGGSGGAFVTGVAGLELDSQGYVRAERIGSLSGGHGQGELAILGARNVTLRLDGTRAKLAGVTGDVTITGRQARFEIVDSQGVVDVGGNGVTTTIANHTGAIRINGGNGRVTIDGPRADTKVDVRRAEVQVTIREPVPLTILTSDEPVRLLLAGTPAVTLDLVATEGGRIRAEELNLTAEVRESEERLAHVMNGGTARRITVRNLRGNIVIGRAK